MAGRRLTAAKARDRKQKRIAALLGVVFVVVAIVQVPKLMKQLNAKPPSDAPSPAQSAATPATAAATPVTGAIAAAGQLRDFSSLPLKDPFHSQVKEPANPSPVAGSSGGARSGAKPKPQPKPAAAAAEPAASGAVSFTAKAPPPNAAVLKTNGQREIVYLGDGFPNSEPLFRLVALTGKNGVRIGVFGGSFTSGAPTIKLARGKDVTLANQADGSRYVLELVKLTTVRPKLQQQTGATAASATTAGSSK
jgi:hypothetical protein